MSGKMLTAALRSLEHDGLVRRQLYSEASAHVEYALTKLGWSLTEPLMGLYEWAEGHIDEVREARLSQ